MYNFIKTITISLIIIAIFHYLFLYIKNNYTHTITKDILNNQTQKYLQIINTMNKKENINYEHTNETYENDDNISVYDVNMENELLQHAMSEL